MNLVLAETRAATVATTASFAADCASVAMASLTAYRRSASRMTRKLRPFALAVRCYEVRQKIDPTAKFDRPRRHDACVRVEKPRHFEWLRLVVPFSKTELCGRSKSQLVNCH